MFNPIRTILSRCPARMTPASTLMVILAVLLLGAVAAPLSAQVNTRTTLVSAPNPSTPGQAVTLTATVEAPGQPAPEGEVVFRDGAVQIGVAVLEAMGVGVADVSAGRWHTSCALAADGRVFCWGLGGSGQLGNGTTDFRSLLPVQVTGLTTAVALSSGFSHSCALLPSGAVQCWGSNLNGALGNGSTTSSPVPVTVSGISTAGAISAGSAHSCAALASGQVLCWGFNSSGQLGNGTTANSTTPVAVTGMTTAVSVTASFAHSCARLAAGTVQCWGRGDSGELGDGASADSAVPVAVSGLSGVASVSAGGRHSCALLTSGAVQCWGSNSRGQLGNGTTTNSATPVTVTGISNAVAVSAGGSHSCAVLASGEVRCWGGGVLGQLGNGVSGNSSVPVAVSNMSTATSVSGSSEHSCARLASGIGQCWGWGEFGALGNGRSVGSGVPVTVAAMGGGGMAQAQLTTTTLAEGTRSLTAHFAGGGGLGASTSAPLMHEVAMLEVAFSGGGAIFGQTAACAPALGGGAHGVTIHYRPSELGGLPSELSLVWPEGSEHLALWGAMAPSVDFLGAAGRQSWSRFVFYPTRPRMRVVTRQVTRPAGASLMQAQELVLRLRAQNFAAIPDCAATIAATLRRGG